MNSKNTILVTGANGFIGGRIVERILLDGVGEARAGIHSLSSAARVARFPADIRLCDVTNKDSLPALLDGADTVVHTAYGSRSVTEEGTANMLEASHKAGVKLFVHFSTVEVYGDIPGTVDESSPLRGVGEYAESKINAEKMCWDYYKRGLPVVVIRPSVVYGPFSKPWTIRLAERFVSGKWKIPTGVGGLCTPVYVDDVVNATFLAIGEKRAVGEAFNVGGPEVIKWTEFFERFNESMGLPSLKMENATTSYLKAVAMAPVRLGAKFALNSYPDLTKKILSATPWLKKFAKQGETTIKTSISLEELSLYKRSSVYGTEKARRVLGYEPRFNLKRGLGLTSAWLKHQGYLPSKIEELGY